MIHSAANETKAETIAAQTQPKTNLTMMTRNTKHIEEQEFTKTFQDKNEDHHYKLEIAMNYLDKIDYTKGAAFYFERSREIMQHLHQEFQKHGVEEIYLPWVRYLDISARKKEEYPGKREGSEGFHFKQGMEELIMKVLSQNQSSMIDWRIAKKILSMPNLFPEEKSQLMDLIQRDAIFKAVQSEIDKALEYMIWLGSNSLLQIAKKPLEKLSQCCRDEFCRADLVEAIISGRFDKTKFGLSHSLILGEDGGLYMLLNRLTKAQQEDMIAENIVTKAYLNDKIVKQKAKDEKAEQEEKRKQDLYGEKAIIGKGGFGSVKFAVSLFHHNGTSPGDVICIKKSRSFTALDPSNYGGMIPSSLQQATEATIGDYFASGIADKVYAPQIFDLAIISHQSAYQGKTDHRKGYLMMEMLPQNTATRIFEDTKYQKWIYQKPYLLEVFSSTLALLKENIAFTDLKPDNTLYDTNILKTTMIDLGGIIKVDTSIETFEKNKFSFQTTPEYRAPEMGDSGDSVINLPKALAFTCGQLMKEVAQQSDYNDAKELQALIENLTHKEPDQRISIEEAIDILEKMGDDSYKEDVVFRHYIAKIQERIENNRSSISLNEDILETKQLHINQNITSRDPERYPKLNTEDLFKKIDSFLLPNQKQYQVMAVFGAAGSGKSIALQLKFIEAIRNWQTNQPLSIYFNLANGIELKTIIDSMNQVLGTHITFQDLRKKGVHLYIDSFDEGLGLDSGRREILIQEYMKELCPHDEKAASDKVKFIISCRTDYLVSESNYKWFTPRVSEFDKLLPVYIVPIDYKRHYNLKEMISIYAKHKSKDDAFVEKTQKKIEALHLQEMITTGFMFYIILEVVSELKDEEGKEDSRNSISKREIFRKYVSHYQEKESRRYNEKQISQLHKMTEYIYKKKDQEAEKDSGDPLNTALRELGQYIAVQLHLLDAFRLDQTNPLFHALEYDSAIYFKKQTLAFLLKILPLKIETKYFSNSKKNKKQNQEVKIGFIHDTIKNSYLLEAIQDEMRITNGNSEILSNKSIVADVELVRFIADAARHDLGLTQHLRRALDLTKTDKSERAAIYAANSITILVAARYSFTCQDLSNINIRGANIQNGIFSGADFSGADLSYINLRNIQANDAKFVKTNLKAAKFGVLPDLQHPSSVSDVSFSHDGKYIASGSSDGKVRIWAVETSTCIATLQGHTQNVTSVCFSTDGKYVASASMDKTVKLWETHTFKCVPTRIDHNEYVTRLNFSPDGKYIATSSPWDNTFKLWRMHTFICVTTLECLLLRGSFSPDGKYIALTTGDKKVKLLEMHTFKCVTTFNKSTETVFDICFSPHGTYVVSSSLNKTFKIWEVETSKCIADIKAPGKITRVSFSPDGKYLATAGYDMAVTLWDAQTFKWLISLQGHKWHIESLSFSGGSRYIASAGGETVKIWEVQTFKCLAPLQGHNSGVWEVSFSSEGKRVTSLGLSEEKVKIWDLQTSKCLSNFAAEGWVSSCSRDGKCVASISVEMDTNDTAVKIWDLQTSEILSTLPYKVRIHCISISGDGKYIATGFYLNSTVKVWEVETKKCLATLIGQGGNILSVSFSPDGNLVASGSRNSIVNIWEVQTSKSIACLGDTNYINHVFSVSFSPNGKLVASGLKDSTVKIWEVQASECIATLTGHTRNVNGVSFSGDGKYLASCSSDKTVRIWAYINGSWYCDKIFSAVESILSAVNAKVEQVIASKRNKTILKQLAAKGEMNNKKSALEEEKENERKDEETDETERELKPDLTLARSVANEFSELFLEKNRARYKELKQKFANREKEMAKVPLKRKIISKNRITIK